MTPAGLTVLSESEAKNTFVVEANGTNFFISIKFANEFGQTKTIFKTQFSKIKFESVYTSPFAMGHLQLIEHEQQNKLKPAIGNRTGNTNYDTTGTGGEFIHINIKQQVNANRNNQIIILNKTFIVKRITESMTGKTPMLNYYFADTEFGSLLYNRLPWSTNKPNTSQLNSDDKQVYVSDAILDLLVTFCGSSKKDARSIINKNKWNESISKTEHSLRRNQSPLDALNTLMSKYVSKEHNDMGLLLKHAGKFKLLSLTNIFKYESRPSAAIKIELNDNRSHYTKHQFATYFSKQYKLIPVHISKVQFYPKNPDTAVDVIIDHSISSYNTKTKSFNLYNNNGSVKTLKKDFNNIISYYPFGDTREANIEKTSFTGANKSQRMIYENSNQSQFLGKTSLQSKLIQSADRVSFTMPGNFFPSGGKFIGIELGGIPANDFMKKVSGFWFVLQNTTTLTVNGGFNTFLVCSQLDKEKT